MDSRIDEELRLRLVTMEDAAALFELTDQSREHLKEWLPWVDGIKTIEDTKAFIELSTAGFIERQNLNAVILYKGKAAGIAGFNALDQTNRIAKIGYWLGKPYEGLGIMTKTVKFLTDYAFDFLNMNRVEIRAATGNRRSRSIPERLKFTNEGTIREAEWLYNHFVDHSVYGMLSAEWKKEQ